MVQPFVHMANEGHNARNAVGPEYVHMGDESHSARSAVGHIYAHMVDENHNAKIVNRGLIYKIIGIYSG